MFRAGRSTTDQMLIIRQLYQITWEIDKKKLYTLFVNFRKSYDNVHRESILNIMKEFQFPQKLVNLISCYGDIDKSSGGKFNNWPGYSELGAKTGRFAVTDSVQRGFGKGYWEMKIGSNEGIRLQETTTYSRMTLRNK